MPEVVESGKISIGMEGVVSAPMPEVAELREESIGMEGGAYAPMQIYTDSATSGIGTQKCLSIRCSSPFQPQYRNFCGESATGDQVYMEILIG